MEAGQLPRRPRTWRPASSPPRPSTWRARVCRVESMPSPPHPAARLPHGPASFYSRSRWLGLTETKAKSGSPWPPSFHSRAPARGEVRAGRRRPSPSSRSPGASPLRSPRRPGSRGLSRSRGREDCAGKRAGLWGPPRRGQGNSPTRSF